MANYSGGLIVKKFQLSLQWKFFLCIVVIILPVLSIIFTWTGIQNEKQAMEQVLNQARVLARQVILTRQWVTDCGGVMIPRESKGAEGIAFFLMTGWIHPEVFTSDLRLQW